MTRVTIVGLIVSIGGLIAQFIGHAGAAATVVVLERHVATHWVGHFAQQRVAAVRIGGDRAVRADRRRRDRARSSAWALQMIILPAGHVRRRDRSR